MDTELLKKAGKIVAQVREETVKIIVEGAKFLDIINFAEDKIKELGGEVAWVQLSPTTTAAHFCPTLDNNPVCTKGDLLKLDVGVHIEGNIADTAISVQIDTNEYDDLIQCSEEALEETLKLVKPGVMLRELGAKQTEIAEKYGYKIVRNLSGHSLGDYLVHSGLTVPTFDNNNETKLKEGDVIAIEPFITTGAGLIEEKGKAVVFMEVSGKPTRSTYGRKLLPYIKARNGLPFTENDLLKEFSKVIVTIGLRDLVKDRILQPYAPLVEIANKPVAQTEHSCIVTSEGNIVYTK